MEVLSSEELFPRTQEKLYAWWRDSVLCDVTLVCVDSVRVQAHSLYLALHSSYFHQHFETANKEEQPYVLKIDMPSSVLNIVLEFIYSGQLHISGDNIRDVNHWTEKYRFDSIVRLLKNSKFYPTNVKKHISKNSKLISKMKQCDQISANKLERISFSRDKNETIVEKCDEMAKSDLELQCVRRSARVRKKSSKIAYFVDFSDDGHSDEDNGYSESVEDENERKSKKSRLLSKSKTESMSVIQKSSDRKHKKLISQNKELTMTHKSLLKLEKSNKNVKKLQEKKSTMRTKNISKSKEKFTPVGKGGSFQSIARKLWLSYLTTNFMRKATSRSLERNSNNRRKEWFQCFMCQRKFHTYTCWRYHYRTQHLSHLLQRISRTTSKKVPCLTSKTRRSGKKPASSSGVMMKSGRERRMPGPKCSQSPGNMVGCEECGVKLASRASLKKHLMAYHNMDRSQTLILDRFACSVCSSHFKKSSDQKIHEQLQHGVQHQLIIHSCEETGCEYKTTAVRYLNAHRRTRHRDNSIQCSYCNIKLKSKVALQMHVNALHLKKRPYLCEVCGSGFCDQWTLQRHIAFRHSSARTFSCRHCSYACNNRIQFMNHSYQQHGERVESDSRKELTCPHCQYTALSASRMNAHVRHIHAEPHKYTCEICGKGFKNPHYLRDHQVIHSDTTLQCPHCDYSPLTSSKLKKHVRTQHLFKDMKPYSCPYCPFACTLSGNCRKHVSHKHPGSEVRYNTDSDMMAYMRTVEAQLQAGKISSTC